MYTDHGDGFGLHYFGRRHNGEVRYIHQQITNGNQWYADVYRFWNVP